MFRLSNVLLCTLVCILCFVFSPIYSMRYRDHHVRTTVNYKSRTIKKVVPASKKHQKDFKKVYPFIEDDIQKYTKHLENNHSKSALHLFTAAIDNIQPSINHKESVFSLIERLSDEIDPLKNCSSHSLPSEKSYFIPDQKSADVAIQALEDIYARAIYVIRIAQQKTQIRQTPKLTTPKTPEFSENENESEEMSAEESF